jgi:integrase
MAPSTVALHARLLRAIFTSAVLDRLIPVSPAVRVSLPRADRPRIVPLTVAQVRATANAVPERNAAMVLTQAGDRSAGLGELLALRSADVDFLGRTVRIEWQLEAGTRQRVEPKTPGRGGPSRCRRSSRKPSPRHMHRFPPLADGTLFYGHNRRPYANPMYTARILAPAVASLVPAVPGGTSSHDLRHHYASVLLAAGESGRRGRRTPRARRRNHGAAGLRAPHAGLEDRTRRAIDAAWRTPADSMRTGSAE